MFKKMLLVWAALVSLSLGVKVKVWPLAGDVPLNTPVSLVNVLGKLQFAQAGGRLEGCGNETL